MNYYDDWDMPQRRSFRSEPTYSWQRDHFFDREVESPTQSNAQRIWGDPSTWKMANMLVSTFGISHAHGATLAAKICQTVFTPEEVSTSLRTTYGRKWLEAELAALQVKVEAPVVAAGMTERERTALTELVRDGRRRHLASGRNAALRKGAILEEVLVQLITACRAHGMDSFMMPYRLHSSGIRAYAGCISTAVRAGRLRHFYLQHDEQGLDDEAR